MDAIRRTQWMASVILALAVLLLAGLVGRVVWIQRNVTPEMRERLSRQYTAVIPLMAGREPLLFVNGQPAALGVRMYNLYADPAYIMDPAGKLNPLKDEQIEDARKMLVDAALAAGEQAGRGTAFRHRKKCDVCEREPAAVLWLAKEVDEDFYSRFMELKTRLREESRDVLKADMHSKDAAARAAAISKAAVLYHALDGVGFVKTMKRTYPMGSLAGSIIGFSGNDGGVDGMERQVDDMLRGIPGKMYVTKDAARQTLNIQDQQFTPADDGRSVWLTIDTVVQGIAEEQLKQAVVDRGAVSGTAIVMDPYTGKILAIANYPFFDPAHFGEADPDTRRDRAVTDPYEPGSIFKPFVMAEALERHVVKPTDVFDCHGGVYIDPTGRTVRDTHGYGVMSVADILVKSSNIGMTQIGWKMGIPMVYEAVTKFGFGKPHGRGVAGGSGGDRQAAVAVEQGDADVGEFWLRSRGDTAAVGAGVLHICQRRVFDYAAGDRGGGGIAGQIGAVDGGWSCARAAANHQQRDGRNDEDDHGRCAGCTGRPRLPRASCIRCGARPARRISRRARMARKGMGMGKKIMTRASWWERRLRTRSWWRL